eukprot:m.390557 g.390557  ORF g.390557 m.390557 type:complete len:84 (+) comp56342_c0_seq26:1283-1534(+)
MTAHVCSALCVGGELSKSSAGLVQGAFFNRISDPAIGGMYITFLNTVSNIGGTWPKWFVLSAMDMATVANCRRVEGLSFSRFS